MSNLFTEVSVEQQAIVAGGFNNNNHRRNVPRRTPLKFSAAIVRTSTVAAAITLNGGIASADGISYGNAYAG
ncbi:MAG: hypothetical protein PT120_13650 [Aphanizomenon gracile PMC649.10]|nr:hypothetical protein [Aphanizomenon gracile PMC649.10]MDM3859767.1 hypothetical protein [Aphanizomenon gracile PMC644.10]